jgi:hypothetical protein
LLRRPKSDDCHNLAASLFDPRADSETKFLVDNESVGLELGKVPPCLIELFDIDPGRPVYCQFRGIASAKPGWAFANNVYTQERAGLSEAAQKPAAP